MDTVLMFLAASTALAFAPGPDNIFVLTQSMVGGGRAGILVTLGLCTGLFVHTAVVTLGLAAVFQTSAMAFRILKYIGAAYLAFLAYKSFRASRSSIEPGGRSGLTSLQLYRRGIIMNVTNPKVSIFFMAFLPQFVNPARGPVAAQFVALGFLFMLVTLLVFGLISLLAGIIGRFLSRSEKAGGILNGVAGTVFAALALKLALTER